MKNKILTALVLVLVLFNIVTIISSNANAEALRIIKATVADLPKEPIVYVGKDGRTPQKNVDYVDGKDGKNGLNSISFVTTETIIKEVPLIGEKGENGKDAPELQLRVNPDTKDLETKYSTVRFWQPLVTCSEYRIECPSDN